MGDQMRKVVISFFILFFHLICSFSADASALEVSAQSSVLMCADTAQIVFAENAHERRSMASTTKIMTALLALESEQLGHTVTVGQEVTQTEGSSLGLAPGDEILLTDLVCGMLLVSGNDAANAVAVAVAGSVPAFVQRMNEKAQQLGMRNTCFKTPSGLDAEQHYSTAYDMAILTRAALQNDLFRDMCSRYTATVEINNKTVWLQNHNRMLTSYDGLIGVKTGFTKKSGRCLVTAAERNGVCLIAVTLKAPDDWNDHKKMLDYGFSVVRQYSLSLSDTVFYVDVVGGTVDRLACKTAGDIAYDALEPLRNPEYKVVLEPFVYAPTQSGDIVGTLYCSSDGVTVGSSVLCLTDSVARNVTVQEKRTFWERIKQYVNGWFANGRIGKTSKIYG